MIFDKLKLLRDSFFVRILCFILLVQIITLYASFTFVDQTFGKNSWEKLSQEDRALYVSGLMFEIATNDSSFDGSINGLTPNSDTKAWQHIVDHNPDLAFYYEEGDRRFANAPPSVTLESLRQRAAGVTVTPEDCFELSAQSSNGQSPTNAHIYICDGNETVYSELGGLSPDYSPEIFWFLPDSSEEFESENFLLSYVVVLLATPLFLYFLLAPLRRVSAAARQLPMTVRHQQLPMDGVHSEVRGVVQSMNRALARIDQGFVREQQLRIAVAHELRTPLTALRSRLEEIKDSPLRTDLVADVGRLNRLINRILEFSQAAQNADDAKDVRLVETVRAACAECGSTALQKGIAFNLSHPDEPIMVRGDATALTLIFLNIINNALCHAKGTEVIDIEISADCVVKVHDKGPGLNAQLKEAINRFGVSDGQGALADNLGFGYVIIFELLRLVGGKIQHSSASPSGAEITVQLQKA